MLRKSLVVPAVLAVGLFAVAQDTRPQPPAAGQPGSQKAPDAVYDTCAKACADCARECERCAKHCTDLVAQGQKEHLTTVATCNDCAAICIAAMRASAARGPLAGVICEACARACDVCGAACDKHAAHDPVMAQCAKACKECAKACRDMVAAVGGPQGPGK